MSTEMRTCTACGNTLTDAATFCPACGAEAPLPAPPPPEPARRFCTACGAAVDSGARFCPDCGAAMGGVTAPPTGPILVEEAPETGPNRSVLIGVGVAVLLIALLFWFNRYEWLGLERPDESQTAMTGQETVMYAVANANLRDKATTRSEVTGKLLRGAKVSGVLQLGEDNASQWFKLGDGSYISAINLSATAPPTLARGINKIWYAPGDTPLLAAPQAGAAVLETAEPGKAYTLIGLTAGGFAEVTLGKGGVGYFDASGIDLAAASAPPIAIAFTPVNCGYGKEIDLLLRKLAQDAMRRQQLAAARDYPSGEARDIALAELETASAYLPLTRGFRGLSVGGIATHYEASSIYFRETPDKVIALFARDYPVGADGVFAVDSEVSSSIQATSGDARRYGQTELICGV